MPETRLLFLCPDTDLPSGGVKVMYQHVDILSAAGFDAFALHWRRGFRCTWFENRTPIISMGDLRRSESDFLVIPETFGPNLHEVVRYPRPGKLWTYLRKFKLLRSSTEMRFEVRGFRKVIFNQNGYLTFTDYSFDPAPSHSPYLSPEVVATLCISQNSLEYLQMGFPKARVERLYNAIETDVFTYSSVKKPLMTFMPRKNLPHAQQVINLLHQRKSLRGFEVVAIEGLNRARVAEAMRDSLFFLSFGYPEGWPLPPAEAMVSGAVVIGYHGNGGAEYFDPDWCFPVAFGDILGFVEAVERAIELWRSAPGRIAEMGARASRHIRENFSEERQRRSVIDFWTRLLAESDDRKARAPLPAHRV